MENLLKCNGKRFRAKIQGAYCEGKIRVEDGKVYLCQNEKNGSVCREKFGYKYSWDVTVGGEVAFETFAIAVTDFQLLDMTAAEIEAYKDWQVGDRIKNDDEDWEVIFRSGKLVICENSYGNATSACTCDELYRCGWRLVADPVEEDETVELTLDEIAAKFGIKAEKLRIKKEEEK